MPLRLNRPPGLAALVLCATGAAGVYVAAAPVAAPQQVFRSGVNLVQLPVVVTAKDGAFVRGLTAGDFRVTEDGVPQDVRYFAEGADASVDDRALHVGLLLDVSESMGGDLPRSTSAAVRFVNALDEASDVTLVDFDTEVRLARYQPSNFERLFERIRSRRAAGATALFDAVGMFLRSVSALDGQKVLLLYTDGGDTTSALSYGKLLDALKGQDVLVYAIGYVDRRGGMLREQMQLTEMARDTGGESWFPQDARELNEIYAKILDELMSRYTLGYLSTNPKSDGKWRKVEVTLAKPVTPRPKLRTRPGYFAPVK